MVFFRAPAPVAKVIGGALALILVLTLLSPPEARNQIVSSVSTSQLPELPSWARFSSYRSDFGFMPQGPKLDALCAGYRWDVFPYRYQHRKIFDLIMVNDEVDALLIRMGEMTQVDYFVIVESDLTFSDQQKPLHVQENMGLFKDYRHKMIIHTLNTTGEEFADTWAREKFSRNAMFDQVFPNLSGKQAANLGDIIIVGDVDELVRPEVLIAMRNCQITKHVRLWTAFYYYSFQWLNDGGKEWDHPDATFFNGLKDTVMPQNLRDDGPDSDVHRAGWHCSYCFPELQMMVNKLKSFSHQEYNTPEYNTPSKILHRVQNGIDLFDRWSLYRIDNNKDVPTFVSKHASQFGYMLDRTLEDGGFVDTWDLLADEVSPAVSRP